MRDCEFDVIQNENGRDDKDVDVSGKQRYSQMLRVLDDGKLEEDHRVRLHVGNYCNAIISQIPQIIKETVKTILPFVIWEIHRKLFVPDKEIAKELMISQANLPDSAKRFADLPNFQSEF